MTNTPPSPYGPADSAPQNQAPRNAAEFHPQAQLPYGYTLAGPTPPKRSNGPGFAALIIGIVSMVVAFIPFANFFSFVLGPAGLICGIIGLILTDRPRRQALWGTVLSGVSMIVAFIMIFVYTFGLIFAVGGAIEETNRNFPRSTQTAEPAPPAEPVELLPFGTIVELVDVAGEPAYEATVTASVLEANTPVLAVAGNTEPPAGMQWAMVTVDVTALSSVHVSPAMDISVEYVSPDGEAFSPLGEYASAPAPAFEMLTGLAQGERGTGNVVIAIPSDDPSGGHWTLSYSYDDGVTEPFYFAVE